MHVLKVEENKVFYYVFFLHFICFDFYIFYEILKMWLFYINTKGKFLVVLVMRLKIY